MSIQFFGLASQVDWGDVIEQMVSVRRRPIDSLIEQRGKVLYEQQVTRSVNDQLTKFNTSLSNMRFESTFLSRIVESSNSSRVSAIAEAGATIGSYSVAVDQLAVAGQAASGLDGTLYSKVANISTSQNMGITGLTPYSDFQATRALANTLIADTQQAGTSGADITTGDQISITGQLKDGTNVSGTFTFAGNSTDTLQRLATAVAQVFQGEVSGSVGSNGELVFIETDPSIAGDITFNTTLPPLDLQFVDADYSGSTLTFGIGDIVAGAAGTNRRLVQEVTFTTGGVLEGSDATDIATLDQVLSGVLNAGDIFRITGTESGGASIGAVDFTYTGAVGGQTIAELVTAIDGAFATATASYENGKLVLTGTGVGPSSLALELEFVDAGAATSFNLGDFTVVDPGLSDLPQMVTTAGFSVEGTGQHQLSSTDGKAGKLRGNVTIFDPSNTLESFAGVNEFSMFTIDPDGAAGSLGPVTITGLSQYSTVQDLIDAINTQIPTVTAQLYDAGGNYRFEIVGNQGGQDIRVYDDAAGILQGLLQPASTDLDTLTNDLSVTFASTTDTNDVTIIDWFTPDNGGPKQRRVWTGDEGLPVDGLIGGVAIQGANLNAGVATIVTANSAELNTTQDMYTYLYGAANIAESPATHIPAINPALSLAAAGFATTPQNAADNPLFHTNGFFTINGVRITVGDVNTTTLNELLGTINASGAGVTATFDAATSRLNLRSNTVGPQDISLGGQGDTSNFLNISGLSTDLGGVLVQGQVRANVDSELPLAQSHITQAVTAGVFTINGVKITLDPGVDSLNEVINKIERSGAGVKASYDPIADRLTLTQVLDENTTRTRIEIGDPADTSNFLEALNLIVDTTVPKQIGTSRQTSLFTVNGVSFERKSNNITDVIDKVTLNLNAVTNGVETINVTSDSDRLEAAIIEFVYEYNVSMEMINAIPLSKSERTATEALTEEDAQSMTLDEIESYIARRDSLMQREFLAGDPSTRSITNKLQALVTGWTENDGFFNSIGQLGLTTAEVGTGAEQAAVSQGRLLGPTSDKETLTSLIKSNSTLQDAIRNSSDDLYDLFASLLDSRYDHQGTIDLSSGIVVQDELRFTIGDGNATAEILLGSGTYTQTNLLNLINSKLVNSDLGGSTFAYYDAQDQLNLRSASSTGQSLLQLIDNSNGQDDLTNLLGWELGIFKGPDPQVSGGVARRTREYIQDITSVGGIVLERIKQNGSFDRQVQVYDDAIESLEYNLANYEQRLRDRFSRLEVTLSQLQSQGQALESAIAKSDASS